MVRSQGSSCPGEVKWGYLGGFWDDGDVLLLDLGVGYTGVFSLGELIQLNVMMCAWLLSAAFWPVCERWANWKGGQHSLGETR